jgi:tetratricopeptide (TPR) repeat protein
MFSSETPRQAIGWAGKIARKFRSKARGVLLCEGVLLVCATASSEAQAPSPPAESASVKMLNRAIAMAEHGDRPGAMVLADSLLQKHPDLVPALKLKGMLLEESGRGAEASRVYERALELAPNDPGLLFKMAVVDLAASDYVRAIQLLLRHLKTQPRDGDALFYLAQAYRLNGQDDLALKTIRECVKIAPDNAQAWQKYGEVTCASGDNQTGLRLLLKARQLDPTLQKIDLDIGTAYTNAMDFPTAVKYLAMAAAKRPGDKGVLAQLASAQIKLSQWQDARSVFKRILALEENDEDSLLGLGECELELKQYAEAIDTLRRALQVDPALSEAHYYLSRAYAALGRTDEARHEAELHQRIDQMSFVQPELGSEENKFTWDQARQLLAERRESEALSLFQKASQNSSSSHADPYVFIGSLYLSMGEAENALRILHRAWEIDPRVRGAHTYAGLAALQANDLDTAEKEFQAELANDRNYLPAIAELGEVRYRQHRWAEAAELLSNSRTGNPWNQYMLCDSLFHLGKMEDAELTAEVVASHAQREPEIMRALIELLNRNGASALSRRLSENHP